jgi:hypothetical protein
MNGKPNTVHDFLKHRTQERGGAFLKNWKERGHFEHFLHMRHIPTVVWSHQWPTLVVREDKQTKEAVTHVWSKQYNCPETEQVLKKQYFRDRDTQRRKFPPEHCGMCRLLDWVYMQIVSGNLSLEVPIFRVAGSVEKERTTITAAGFCGQLKEDKLSEEGKKKLRDAGVSFREGYRENCMAKAGYVAVVVDAAAPSDGAQITTIAASLGDKLKDVITDKMIEAKKTKGDESYGDPFARPYQFEWIYDEKAPNPNDKYRVRAFLEAAPSKEILEVISDDGVSTDLVFAPMDQASLRMRLERACLLTGSKAPPWDQLFPVAAKGDEADREDEEDTSFPPADEPAGRVPEVGTPPPAGGVDVWECELCKKDSPSPTLCVHCGAKYDDEGNLIKAPEPPAAPKQTRRGTKKEPAAEADAKPKSFKPGF